MRSTTVLQPRTRGLSVSTGVTLTTIVVVGTFVRLWLALGRDVPRYLPDEYLYGQLARSLATGHGVAVLGVPASFPALLEPLLLAPLWGGLSATTALVVTQAFHALLMALAAVPVFRLARLLDLGDRAALLCATASVVAPGLFFASLVTAEALGYLLALLAILAAVRALASPGIAPQVGFLAAAVLATGARLQYAVLVPLYAVGALAVERSPRVAVRRHALVVGACGLGAAASIAGPQVLGRYHTVTSFRVSGTVLHWFGSGAFLLCVATGVVLIPASLAWGARAVAAPISRARTAFAVVGLGAIVGILAMASVLTVETVSDRFLERYLIVGAPLAALGFAAWLAEGRPHGRIVAALGGVLLVVAARLPLSTFTGGQGVADSPTLMTVKYLEEQVDVSTASLGAAVAVTAGAVVLMITALRRSAPTWPVVAFVGALLLTLSLGAQAWDRGASANVERGLFTQGRTWIDDAGAGDALLVQTSESLRFDAMITALLNRSIATAAPLGKRFIDTFDGLELEPLTVARDGRLLRAGRPVTTPIVWALGGTAAAFDDAERLVYDERFALVVPRREVRLAMVATGIRHDGKVSQRGSIQVFPTRDGQCTRMRLELVVPKGVPPTTLLLRSEGATRTLVVGSGQPARATVVSRSSSPAQLSFRAIMLGNRRPGPGDGTVANVRYTAGPVACAAGADRA